jgi:tetratricopeptide (TPR) repeat protein
MRVMTAAFAALAIVALGALQLGATAALRSSAQAFSAARALPPQLVAAIVRVEDALPLPSPLRLVLARHALETGDDAAAAREIERLPVGADRLALAGELAERRGDLAAAARAFLDAGASQELARLVDAAVARGDVAAALDLQRRLVARLERDRTQPDVLAEAAYRLGNLEERAAVDGTGPEARRAEGVRRALRAYRRALGLAPLDERYLLALANQEIDAGDLDAAQRLFARARDADPTSAEPYTGFGDIALRRGDRSAARAALARARALDPRSAAVARLAAQLGS